MYSSTKAPLLLARYAEALPNGLVYIMGGCVTTLPPTNAVVFIAGGIEMSWDAIGASHKLRFDLLDDQGPVVGDNGPVSIEGHLNPAVAPGIKRGHPLVIPIAQPVGPLDLAPDSQYEFRWEIDGETQEDWRLGFRTAPEAQSQVA